jgi:hypothetical protein
MRRSVEDRYEKWKREEPAEYAAVVRAAREARAEREAAIPLPKWQQKAANKWLEPKEKPMVPVEVISPSTGSVQLQEFYILWNPGSNLPPRVTIRTLKEATTIAENMARRHPGEVFCIAKIGSAVQFRPEDHPVNRTKLERNRE